MKRLEYTETLAAFKQAQNIVLTAHKSPDGDAVGSTLGLLGFLEKLGKNVTAVVPDKFPAFLSWMPNIEKIIQFDKAQKEVQEAIKKADLVVSLDYNVLSRVGKGLQPILENCNKPMIIIDHHREPAQHFVNYIHDIESCSTAQLVFDFLDYTNNFDQIDLNMAQAIYTGILTDTGSFRFPSTSARTHQIVGRLMEMGLKPSEVYNNLFDTNSFDRLKLLGYVLGEKLIHRPELGLAYVCLTQAEMDKFNYQPGDTEGFVNYALSIKGVNRACLMKEDKTGFVKMSFRSKGDVDVNTFARTYFDGGGHLNAAGGAFEQGLKKAETLFLQAVTKEVQA